MSTELFRKYDIPGPRYTSYPTVPLWDKATTPWYQDTQMLDRWASDLCNAYNDTINAGGGAALYIHIPFCHTLCTYCGCHTITTRNKLIVPPYINALKREWLRHVALLGNDAKTVRLSDLHLGGGTPTYLEPAQLADLLSTILSTVTGVGLEIAIEADPRVTTHEHLRVLHDHGCRRLSLGIQDFDTIVQKAVHRVQNFDTVASLVDAARSKGFESLNFDLIYGLPFQTLDSIRKTIAKTVQLRPDRIAFYSYAHVPWMKPAHRKWTEDDLPSGEEKRRLYETGRALLLNAGYREIGLDHFSLPEEKLSIASDNGTLHRNFMGYTPRRVNPIIPLGISAIGDSWHSMAQNIKGLDAYYEAIEQGRFPLIRGHLLSEEDKVLRTHILNLMTVHRTSWKQAPEVVDFLDGIDQRLQEFLEDKLITIDDQCCTITKKGLPFMRNICMAFDARLFRKAPGTTMFSRTI